MKFIHRVIRACLTIIRFQASLILWFGDNFIIYKVYATSFSDTRIICILYLLNFLLRRISRCSWICVISVAQNQVRIAFIATFSIRIFSMIFRIKLTFAFTTMKQFLAVFVFLNKLRIHLLKTKITTFSGLIFISFT